MTYRNRIACFSVASVVLHLAAVLAIVSAPRGERQIVRAERIEPIVLTLNRPEFEPERKLIERGAVTDEPVKDTDFISDANTRAQDQSDEVGDEAQPFSEDPSDVDQMPRAELIPAEPADTEAPVAPEERAAEAVTQPAPVSPAAVADAREEPAALTMPAAAEPRDAARAAALPTLAEATEVEETAAEEPEPEDPERFEVAQAEAAPQVHEQPVAVESVRSGGGARTKGFTSFEAQKHEMGEYMLDVRRRVERHWRSGLHLRYGGSTRAYAVVKCAIRPDGTLASSEIIDYGPSTSYAILCREAIVRAAPFAEFPFDVPEIYRTKELEITWRFSYM